MSRNGRLHFLNEISALFYEGKSINTENTTAEKCNDIHDDMFIECFVESNADYIITQDYRSGMQNVSSINVLNSIGFIKQQNSEIAIDK